MQQIRDGLFLIMLYCIYLCGKFKKKQNLKLNSLCIHRPFMYLIFNLYYFILQAQQLLRKFTYYINYITLIMSLRTTFHKRPLQKYAT